jgi:serine phosphatase RsbU (regulator of sigma subunit)
MLDSVTVQQPVTDADGSVVDFLITFATSNARDFAGRGRDELVGRTISELYPALDREFIETYVRVLRSGEPLHVSVFPYVDDAGTTRLYDLGVSRVGEELLVVWRDITDRESQRSATARAEAIRAMSEQLQRGLLPPAPPDVPGLRFAATYRPASETAEVGGDWYAVVELADHGERAVDVVVGDVEGHDGAAAALMARLSTVVAAGSGRALAPHAVLEDVHSFHATLGTERLASVLLARVFPESGRVLVVSAGHPAPLLWRADGSVSRLAVAPGPPVGTQNSEAPTAQLRLSSGDTLVLFSDGLLDPQLDTDDAYAALVGVIARQRAGSLQALVDVLAETTRTYAPSDDVVVMAVRLES